MPQPLCLLTGQKFRSDENLSEDQKLRRRQLIYKQIADVGDMLNAVAAFSEDYIALSRVYLMPAINELQGLRFLDGKTEVEVEEAKEAFEFQMAITESGIGVLME